MTAGYGVCSGYPNSNLETHEYTNNFGGTSSASALVAGAATLFQSYQLGTRGVALAPSWLRGLFEQTGYSQAGGCVGGCIGTHVNLRSAAEACWCKTPGQGTSGYNGFSCMDGTENWCASNEECYQTGFFPHGEGCRYVAPAPTPPPPTPPPAPTQCYCRTPGQGTDYYNGYTCDDGTESWCLSGQECYLNGWWELGQSYPPYACRTPTPTYCLCRTPGQGTSGYNGYDCDDGTDGWCQGHQECYLNGWWPQGQSYPPDACRTPGCSWRQTGNCDPNGPREPHSDRACWEQIPAGWSGFCDCNGNNYKDWDEPGYDCSSTPYRCDTACR